MSPVGTARKRKTSRRTATNAAPIKKARLSPKQIRAIARGTARVNIYEGAIRSGKTFSSILAWLAFIAMAPENGELVMVGKNKDSLYRNVFAPIENEPALAMVADHCYYRQGSNVATILGRKVHIIGANDGRAEARIRGMTVAGAYIDELTVLPADFFKQMLGRMSVTGARLFATTNPDSPSHWLKVDYLDKIGATDDEGNPKLPGWRRFHFVLDDNPHLDEDYKNQIKREYTGLWYRRFIEGLWVSAEGAIFDMWDETPFNDPAPAAGGHIIKWSKLPRMQDLLCVGIDYGTTNPTSAILLGLGIDGRLYLIDEYRHEKKMGELGLSDKQLTDKLKEWLNENHLPYDTNLRPKYIIVDPAAASLKTEMHIQGIRNVEDADNSVLYGIRTVASLLGQKLLVTSDRCTGWIKEAPGYSWDPKKQEQGEDAPLKMADHSCDAVRYALTTTERLWRHRLNYSLAA
jgi:PBSX family phage terminase large subunit